MARKILIAQSLSNWRDTLEKNFSNCGSEVIIAESTKDALAYCCASDIDLAIIDYDATPEGGARLYKDIKNREIPTPVIMTIGSDGIDSDIEEAEKNSRAIGVDFFMITPCDLNDMRAVARNLFKLRDKMRERCESIAYHISPGEGAYGKDFNC